MTLPVDFTQIQSWLKEAGNIARSYYQTGLDRRQKDDHSPVTAADVAVEKFLVNKIEQTFDARTHGVMGEESGGRGQGKEFVWVIDPIDGTRIFIDGLPTWCISVGLLRNGEAYRGMVYVPVLNDLYYTNNAGVPFWNERPLTGMLRTTWDRDSFMGVPSGAHRHFDIDFRRLRSFGSVAVHHLLTARGAAVAALHREVSVWDLAGAQAVFAAAGGQMVYLNGQPVSLARILTTGLCREPILAAHPAVLEKLLPRIKVRQPQPD